MLKFSTSSIKLISMVLFLLVSVSFSQDKALKNDLNKAFEKFELVRINTQQVFADSKSGKTLQLQTSEKSFELVLQKNDLRPRRYFSQTIDKNGIQTVERDEVGTYKGFINGKVNSSARINLNEDKIEGSFVSDGTRYFIESAKSFSKSADKNDFVIYRAGSYLNEDSFECHSPLMERIEDGKKIVEQNRIGGLEGSGVLELATDADKQFVDELGGATQANEEILFILNIIDGVFQDQLNLKIQVVFQNTWTTTDPYSGANPEAINNSFKDHWNANFPVTDFPRDAAHLFSAKSQANSQGFAFIGAVCRNPTFAYGISGRVSFQNGRLLLTSHELGHTVGGNHVDSTACNPSIMNTNLNGASPLEFCPFSTNEIDTFVANSGSCLAPPTESNPIFDFDGDSKSDVSIFRSEPNSAQWWLLRSSDFGGNVYAFGEASDTLVPADYTGDGRTDVAFWRESTGEWFILRSEDGTFYSLPFGTVGDIPAPGDFDGDGQADQAVYRPSSGTWFVNNSSGGNTIVGFGISEDKPVVGDYDGDGMDDVAIYRPSLGQWWLNRSTDGVQVFQFGMTGDKTVQGDYTGDGKTDVAFWRPSTGEWFVIRSEDQSFFGFPFGANTDVPIPGDYDGDGKQDAAVFRPSTSTWFLQGETSGTQIVSFGFNTDIPLASSYVYE